MKKILKWTGIVLGIVFIGIQAIRPEKTNPTIDPARTIDAVLKVPQPIHDILAKSCYDCHSYQTRWPWYSEIAPISWLVVKDVNEGRKHFNLSDWAKYNLVRQSKKLSEMTGELTDKTMPLPIYLIMHGDAKLTDPQRKALVDWAENEADNLSENNDSDSTKTPYNEHH